MAEGVDRIVYVGHATVLIELDGVRLLTDPVLGGWLGPLRRQGPAPGPEVVEGLDAVLISHLHRDHVDLRSLRRLPFGVPLIVPGGTRAFFETRRPGAEVIELAPGEAHRLGGVTITATPADHALGRRGVEAIPVGFLVEGTRSLYFAGDTDLFDGMATLAEDLDLALLPVWGWGPTLGPGHLNPERAARAATLLAPRIAVPIHWGTLYPAGLARLRPRPLSEPPREFAARVRALAPGVDVRVPAPGEAVVLGGGEGTAGWRPRQPQLRRHGHPPHA
ncbi:MAG: MBL fold metallo-hydrolase [Actinobacteria bacterium]|nr:MBL fold metallo-hydrolase [Actinomycetota bacterium]